MLYRTVHPYPVTPARQKTGAGQRSHVTLERIGNTTYRSQKTLARMTNHKLVTQTVKVIQMPEYLYVLLRILGKTQARIKYDTIETIDVVEPDPLLVEVCRKYIPEIANSLTDERVSIFNEDGLRFIRSKSDAYDLIIIDSPNPFGAGEGLFTKEFYGNCYNALREDGVMINQNESPFYTEEAFQCQRMHKRILETFPICRVYQAHIPSYPSGHWLFGFASKKYHPLDDLDKVGWKLKGIHTKYYEPRLHAGVFALPAYVEALLEDVER